MGKIADALAGISDQLADEVMDIEMAIEDGESVSADDRQKIKRAETIDRHIDTAARLASKWGF